LSVVEEVLVRESIRFVFQEGEGPEPDMYAEMDDGLYEAADGGTFEITPHRNPEQAAQVLRLKGERVTDAWSEDGVLSLRFAGGAKFESSPDPQHESWTLVGGGRVYQALPGGDVSSW
jgi:hypothetical protein